MGSEGRGSRATWECRRTRSAALFSDRRSILFLMRIAEWWRAMRRWARDVRDPRGHGLLRDSRYRALVALLPPRSTNDK